MPDLEVMEVETSTVEVAKPSSAEKAEDKSATVFEQARRLHSANWIAERMAATLEGQLSNGSLPE